MEAITEVTAPDLTSRLSSKSDREKAFNHDTISEKGTFGNLKSPVNAPQLDMPSPAPLEPVLQ